ncbi:MAG TPA: hypothetical protein VIB60_02680 [Methylomirabilota bacterium]|jgi:hypothetical protein
MNATGRRSHSAWISGLLAAAWLALTAGPVGAQPKIPKLPLELYDFAVEKTGGTFAILRFRSYNPVVPAVAASQRKLTIKPGGKEFGNPAAEIESLSFPVLASETTRHRVTLENLRPGTDYFLGIIGHRKSGETRLPVLNIKLTTLHRTLKVVFERIEVIDDSDDLSDGEFLFGFFAYDGEVPGDPPPLGELQYPRHYFAPITDLVRKIKIGSGESRTIPEGPAMSFLFAKRDLKLEATGLDDDNGGSYGKLGLIAPHTSSESTSCGDFATAHRTLTLENRTRMSEGATPDGQERHRIPFVLHAHPAKVSLEFKVRGFVDVSYE